MGLKFPNVDPGPLRQLLLALHELHSLAGEPSMRDIGAAVGCSHHKIHQMFTQPRLPGDGDTLFAVAGWLGRQGRRPRIRGEDDDEFYEWFETLWREAKTYEALSFRAAGQLARSTPDTGPAYPPEGVRQARNAGTPADGAGVAPTSRDISVPPAVSGDVVDGNKVVRNFQANSGSDSILTHHRQDRPRALPNPLKSQAILIGASHFIGSDLPDLPAVDNNLSVLSDLLTGELGGFSTERTTTLLNPRSFDMASRLEEAAHSTEDTLLIYYAGHGLVSPTTGSLHLAGADAVQSRLHSTTMPYDVVREIVSSSPARRSVILLDCCFSGRAALMGSTTGLMEAPSTFMIAATSSNRAAIARPGEPFTAFTGALIDVLENGVPGGPEVLDMETIYGAIREKAIFGQLPEPTRRTTGSEPLALRRNVAWRPSGNRLDGEDVFHDFRRFAQAGDIARAEMIARTISENSVRDQALVQLTRLVAGVGDLHKAIQLTNEIESQTARAEALTQVAQLHAAGGDTSAANKLMSEVEDLTGS